MSAVEQAMELRAQADALDAVGRLEVDLAAAKANYLAEPNQDTKEAKKAVALALREARSRIRSKGVTVGGDAYVDEEA